MVAPTTESSSKFKMKFSLDDFRLSDIWEVVQRRWKTLAVSVLAMWALGILYCYLVKQTYESSSQVLVMKKDSSLATTGTPSNSTTKSEVTEDLLATHMMIVGSPRIVGKALERTVRVSQLKKMKEEQRKAEERDSSNLRIVLGRLTGAIQVEPLPETTPIDLNAIPAPTGTPATEGETAPEAATTTEAAAAGTEAVAATTPSTTTPSTTTPSTNAPAAAPVTPSTTAATTPAPTPSSVAATPTTTAPAGTNDPIALVAVDPMADPMDVQEPNAVPGEFRSSLDEAPQEPPGPTADGDVVIMLAELPGIMEELGTGEMPDQYVINNLEVTRGGDSQARDSHVLGLAFRHKDSVEAKLVLEAIIKSYQNFLNDKFADVNREAAKLIEQASKDLEQKLAVAQGDYQKFREQSPILFNGDQNTNIHRSRFDAYQAELATLTVKLSEGRSRLEMVEIQLAMKEKNGLTDLDQLALMDEMAVTRLATLVAISTGQSESDAVKMILPDLTAQKNTLYGQLLGKKSELQGLRIAQGPNHPDVLALTKHIEETEKFIKAAEQDMADKGIDLSKPIVIEPKMVIQAYLRLLRADVDTHQRRERELMQAAAEEEERAKALVVYELEGERLREAVTRAQSFYDTVLDQLRQIDMAKDYSGFVNEVIMSPEFGVEVWPSVPIVLLLCTMVGVAFGGGIACMSEMRDRTFRDPDDIRRDLDLPLLTHVPDLRIGSAKKLVEGSQVHGSIYSFHRPKSRESEVFRGLRTSLFFSTSGQKCQVIMFTSPNQGDGKSTVATNLAVSIAQTGRKVLLVDCDLRRPNIHKLLGLKNDVGMADVIGGEVEPWDAIQATETTNLWGLPAGPLPSNPAELLQSSTFEQFLKMAREKYEYVILDCPPVLAVADPCIVAPRADGVTMVLRVSRDSKPQAARAKDMLARVNGKIIGVVVNASQEAAKAGYGKYGESAYAYSYDYNYGKGYARGYNKYYDEDPSSQRANGGGR